MPTLREASLAVAGRIIDVEDVRDQSGKFQGLRCLVTTGDGKTQTTIKPENVRDVDPHEGDTVLWMVRPGVVQQDGRVTFFTSFVRVATEDDLDRLISAANSAAPAREPKVLASV